MNVITPFNSADNDVRNVGGGETQFACHVDWSSQRDVIDPVKGNWGETTISTRRVIPRENAGDYLRNDFSKQTPDFLLQEVN